MTTELRRIVMRRTVDAYGHRRKKIIVRLEAGDVIGFREENSRTWFVAPISRVFQAVVEWNVRAQHATKARRGRLNYGQDRNHQSAT